MKDDYVYLLKDAKHVMQDRHNESFVDDDNKKYEIFKNVNKRKYEQAVSECKKFKTFIKTLVYSNIKDLSEQEYDCVRAEYRKLSILMKFQTVMMQ